MSKERAVRDLESARKQLLVVKDLLEELPDSVKSTKRESMTVNVFSIRERISYVIDFINAVIGLL